MPLREREGARPRFPGTGSFLLLEIGSMNRQTTKRTRTTQESRTSRQREPELYESRRPERRPPAGGAQLESRLGPYEFQYTVEYGYTTDRSII